MTDSFSFDVMQSPSNEVSQVIQSGLQGFNMEAGRIDEVVPLSVIARDEGGNVIGGVLSRTWGKCCEVMILWVHEDQRGCGVGQRLMSEIEAQAQARGCDLVYLDTFSFQAPKFYEKLGYQINHTIRGYPRGLEKHYMSKSLKVDALE